MTPARWLPDRRDGARLLVVDPTDGRLEDRRITDLPALLAPGDLLVVNDAATLPAALRGHDEQGRAIEARLLAEEKQAALVTEPKSSRVRSLRSRPTDPAGRRGLMARGLAASNDPAEAGGAELFHAVLFGAGDWRQRTEDRPAPPPVQAGARFMFGSLAAFVLGVSARSPRLVTLRFEASGAALWAALYREARPVQYSYLSDELPLWAVQNVYAGRPWAFEMPSAGRPLTWEILLAARRRGVRLAGLTHAAGLSATGDAALDAALPLAERFEIPRGTANAVAAARAEGGRVVAVGTTVVRALEGAAALWGTLRAGTGETDLRLHAAFRPQVVDAVLSGLHGPDESHFALLGAFAGTGLLARAARHATEAGYLSHELGDTMLVLPARPGVGERAPASNVQR